MIMNYIDKYFNLTNKVVVITGGAGFLCSEMALGFHRAGCAIAVLDDDLKGAKIIVKIIADEGGNAVALKMDASKKQDFEDCLKEIIKTFGQIDILINGAGINAPTPFLEITEEEWDRIMAVQLKGTLFSCQVFGKQYFLMLKHLRWYYHQYLQSILGLDFSNFPQNEPLNILQSGVGQEMIDHKF